VTPSTVIRDVTVLGITYEDKVFVWNEKEVRVPASYLVRIDGKEHAVAYKDFMEWLPDHWPGEPAVGATLAMVVRRSWARANGYAT
jgi:hypothetical protein